MITHCISVLLHLCQIHTREWIYHLEFDLAFNDFTQQKIKTRWQSESHTRASIFELMSCICDDIFCSRFYAVQKYSVTVRQNGRSDSPEETKRIIKKMITKKIYLAEFWKSVAIWFWRCSNLWISEYKSKRLFYFVVGLLECTTLILVFLCCYARKKNWTRNIFISSDRQIDRQTNQLIRMGNAHTEKEREREMCVVASHKHKMV